MHNGREFLRSLFKQSTSARITLTSRTGYEWRERGQAAAAQGWWAVDGRADVKVGLQAKMLADELVKRRLWRPSVTHAREQGQPFAGDPIRGALVAEQFAPSAGPGAAPLVFPVSDRTRARHNVDAVAGGKGTRPTTHHVVATAIAPCGQHIRDNAIQARE